MKKNIVTLAKKAGLSKQWLHKILAGKGRPSWPRAQKLAKLTKSKPSWWMEKNPSLLGHIIADWKQLPDE